MLLIVLAVLTLGVIWITEKSPPPEPMDDLLVYNSVSFPHPETLGLTSSLASDSSNWKQYRDENMGFKIRYPEGVAVKKTISGDIVFEKESLHLEISHEKLLGKDTVNTIAEQDVNQKMMKMGEMFKLLDTISPVSIGSITGVTYTSKENSQEITYFYVPLDMDYLLLSNSTDTSNGALISTSDDIIYSLELF